MEPDDITNMIEGKAAQLGSEAKAGIDRYIPASIRRKVLLAIFAAVAVVILWKLFGPKQKPSAVPPMQVAHEASAVSGMTKSALSQPVIVKVYQKEAVSKKLELPPEVAADPHKQVISTAELKPSRGGYVTATVIDTQTGESVTRFTEQPLPWFQMGGTTEIGAGFGVSTRGGETAAVRIRQDLASIKAVTVLAEGEISAVTAQRPEARAMAWVVSRPNWFNW